MKRIFSYCIIVIVTFFIVNFYQIRYPKISYISFDTDKITRGQQIKILQLSDMHDKTYLNKNNHLINKIKEINADIIVITGDLIDWKTKDYNDSYLFVEQLLNTNPNIYFVSGNHEWRNGNVNKFVKGLKQRGLVILNNTNVVFAKSDNQINICGIDDSYSNHDDLSTALNNINNNLYTVLLSHSPNIIFKENVQQVNLILSGHTHGGQVRIPGIGAIVVPGQDLFPKYDKGLFQLTESTKLYIDSGLGTSVYPIRLFNRSQMTLITIKGI